MSVRLISPKLWVISTWHISLVAHLRMSMWCYIICCYDVSPAMQPPRLASIGPLAQMTMRYSKCHLTLSPKNTNKSTLSTQHWIWIISFIYLFIYLFNRGLLSNSSPCPRHHIWDLGSQLWMKQERNWWFLNQICMESNSHWCWITVLHTSSTFLSWTVLESALIWFSTSLLDVRFSACFISCSGSESYYLNEYGMWDTNVAARAVVWCTE